MNSFNYLSGRDTFSRIREHTAGLLLNYGHKVPLKTWQGVDVSNRPEMAMTELMNYTFTQELYGYQALQYYRDDIKPNLPWADDHFEERVCGYPLNPGVEWANWPWGESASDFLDLDGDRFNHNYMERYWPRFAGVYNNPRNTTSDFMKAAGGWQDGPGTQDEYPQWELDDISPREGIRNEYGDMSDIPDMLVANPSTNQAYLPIFHPEDVGDVVGGRKPCSLGYQFFQRDNRLHVYYPMRACDFMRHMQDDIYLTVRLLLWVLDQCRLSDPIFWNEVTPGSLTMHCTSLHVFANDIPKLQQGEY